MVDWAERRVLVTGATGFIGRRLVQRLAQTGAQIYAGVRSADRMGFATHHSPSVIHQLIFDLRDAGAVQAAIAETKPQVVVHLAAVRVTDSGVDPTLALAANTGGTLHLLEALRGQDVRRVVLVGTCYEYGAREAAEGLDPSNVYAASKVAAWAFGRAYWRVHGLPVVTVRPFQVYGPGQPDRALISTAIRAALAGEDFPMTPGAQERDFIYVDDVVEGMLTAAITPGIDGESLDLGTGQIHTIYQVVERIWAMTGARGHILAGALPYRPGEVMRMIADAGRTARLTGWRATIPLKEGLSRTLQAISLST
ncbi:MAG: NAD(P)-dependent oxidoreductase [Chloroflexota bacterium]|nr:NAD(P)-dependent oxidoreductase [Chloroflexota bacterium]